MIQALGMSSILVLGATGQLGGKVVRELVARSARVRGVYRSGGRGGPDAVRALGAEPVAADLGDEGSLRAACEGIDVVVSCVQGLGDVIVDGQTRALRAAEAAGVRRMIPSDYAIDFFKTPEGGNRNLDLRRTFNHVLDGSRVRGSSLLCGAFMDLIAMGRIGPDLKTGVMKVWGDPDLPYDFTHTDDVARYIAAVALDDGCGRYVRVAGDTRSPNQIAAIAQEVRGMPVTIERAGTVSDLSALIARLQAADPAPTVVFPPWQQMQYGRDMASGLGRLEPLDNARFPDIHPISIRDLMSRR